VLNERTIVLQERYPFAIVLFAAIVKAGMSTHVFGDEKLWRHYTNHGVHEFKVGSRAPADIMQYSASQTVTHIGLDVGFVDQKFYNIEVSSSASKMKESLTVAVAAIKTPAIVKEFTELREVVGTDSQCNVVVISLDKVFVGGADAERDSGALLCTRK